MFVCSSLIVDPIFSSTQCAKSLPVCFQITPYLIVIDDKHTGRNKANVVVDKLLAL